MRPQKYSDAALFESISTVLAQSGYEALTFQNIAHQAKVSPATLSKRFGSKADMITAYHEYLVTITRERLSALTVVEESALDKLTDIFTMWQQYIREPAALANFMQLYFRIDNNPASISASLERLRIIDEEVQAIIAKGVEKGEFACSDLEKTSFALQAAATGAAVLWCRKGSNKPFREIARCCIETILKGCG